MTTQSATERGRSRYRQSPQQGHAPSRYGDQAGLQDTEFWAMVGLVAAILISAALINGGDNGTDEFIARQAWLYVSILGAGYFISRGLAKSGAHEPYTDDPSGHLEDGKRGDRGSSR